jgi:hypothetical protein
MASAAVSPQCPTGAHRMPVRMPRPLTQWRDDAVALWTGSCSPGLLNGTRRVSPFHRPSSTGSPPGSNPQRTGWWTIGSGLRETKPAVNEWGVFGRYLHCFWTSTAIRPGSLCQDGQLRRGSTVGAPLPRANAGLLPYECLAGISPVRRGGPDSVLSLFDRKPRGPATIRRSARNRGSR